MSEYSLLFVVFIIAALLKLPGALVGFVAVVRRIKSGRGTKPIDRRPHTRPSPVIGRQTKTCPLTALFIAGRFFALPNVMKLVERYSR
jgi:hypothetical protein